jgi:hypothetical protein
VRKKDTFPTYEEFRNFLKGNLKREFNQALYYTCAMAVLTGGPVSEGHASDVDNYAPRWFVEFENRTGRQGIWTGKELLEVLEEVGPSPLPNPSELSFEPKRRTKRQMLVEALVREREEARRQRKVHKNQ